MAVIKHQLYGDARRRCGRRSAPRREPDARVHGAARPGRGHHRVLREAAAELPRRCNSFERLTHMSGHPGIACPTWPSTSTTTTTSRSTPSPGTCPRSSAAAVCRWCRTASARWRVIGGKVNHFIPNPTFDPIIEPGCLDLLFRGEIPEGVDPASLMKVDRLAEHPEYQNRDARLKVLDQQHLETVFMLPTFACGVEERLKHDIEATMATVHAFNLWLDEDWGFDRPDGPLRLGADHLAGRSRARRSRRSSSCWAAAPSWSACARRRCPAWSRPRSLGDPLARPGVGPAGRGRRPGGLPPVRHRLHGDPGAVGRQRRVQGIRQEGSARHGASWTTAPSTTRWPR